MKKVYLVWYRQKGQDYDRIRGAALNWERAERMARTLEFHSADPIEVGVKTYIHGELHVTDDGCDNRWGTDEFEEETEDESFTTTNQTDNS